MAHEAKIKQWEGMPGSDEADGTYRQVEKWKSMILRSESLKGIKVKRKGRKLVKQQ